MKKMTPKICIVGAGISGLVLGRCLLKRGVKTILFEKSRPSQNRNNYGITLHSGAFQTLLQDLGIEESTFLKAVAVDSAVGGTGRLGKASEGNSFRANRSRFERLLAEGLDIQYEHHLEEITTDSSVVLKFSGGGKHETDLLVGADGVHSKVRQTISQDTHFDILPYAVYNGKRRIPRETFNSEIKRHFQDKNSLETRVGQTVFQVAIDDYSEDKVNISYNYSRPPKANPDPLYRPSRSKTEAQEIPAAFFDEIKSHQLEEPFRSIFNPDSMNNDRILNWLMRTLQVDRQVLDSAVKKNIILFGEAAHAETILGGYGANEAIEDGMKLAEILADGRSATGFYEARFDVWTAGIESSKQRIQDMHSSSRPSL